jgi:hypothetical protein
LFERARNSFSASDQYADEITKIDHYLAILFVEENSFSHVSASRMEVPATLAALNRIEDRAQANYPLVGFLKNLLSKTISQFTQTERELRHALESSQIRVRDLQRSLDQISQRVGTLAPPEARIFDAPNMGMVTGDMGFIIGRSLGAEIGSPGYQCYDPNPTELGAIEMTQAIALGSEHTLQCSRPELRSRLKVR